VKTLVVAFGAGMLFAIGLGISGMTDPARILGFLDVTGHWDPTLAFVMLGAVGVHLGPAQWALRAGKPLLADRFVVAARITIDGRLVAGSVLFGVGWGIAGYCPGPALVDLAAPSPRLLAFVFAMVVGTGVLRALNFGEEPNEEMGRPSPLANPPPL
jgi:uncharacterized membrane protein YedE/YeeE